MSERENYSGNRNKGLQSAFPILAHIGQWLYGVLFWIALAVQILWSARTWKYTATYDYFCGNPLMGEWALWFVVSLVVGAIMLPGGVWSIRHRGKQVGILFIIGYSLYLFDMVFMLIAGVVFGTVHPSGDMTPDIATLL